MMDSSRIDESKFANTVFIFSYFFLFFHRSMFLLMHFLLYVLAILTVSPFMLLHYNFSWQHVATTAQLHAVLRCLGGFSLGGRRRNAARTIWSHLRSLELALSEGHKSWKAEYKYCIVIIIVAIYIKVHLALTFWSQLMV